MRLPHAAVCGIRFIFVILNHFKCSLLMSIADRGTPLVRWGARRRKEGRALVTAGRRRIRCRAPVWKTRSKLRPPFPPSY